MFHNPGGDWHPGRGDNPTYFSPNIAFFSGWLTDLDPHGAPFGMAKNLFSPFRFRGFQDFTNGNEAHVEFFLDFLGCVEKKSEVATVLAAAFFSAYRRVYGRKQPAQDWQQKQVWN